MSPRRRTTAGAGKRRAGRLIVLEGPDGVGKSTVSAAVAESLRARGPCEHLSFPGREPGTLGHLIYRIHHDHAELGIQSIDSGAIQTLHIAAHLDAIAQRIVPALELGSDVVLDRFWWSTLVYGTVAGLNRPLLTALIDVERHAWGKYQPTLVALLRRDVPVSRDQENRDRWLRLRAEYDSLAEEERDSTPLLVVNSAPDALAARDRILAALHAGLNEGSAGSGDKSTSSGPRTAGEGKPARKPGRKDKGARERDKLAKSAIADIDDADGEQHAKGRAPASPTVFVPHLAPARVTAVYDTYWRFAGERQAIFFRRLEGEYGALTNDDILATYKFTNAYRAADRVSQYLIRRVIYRFDLSDAIDEVCFRILLFKLFNRIETWELLEQSLGPLTWEGFRFDAYDRVLTAAMAGRNPIYSAAYIMPPGGQAFGHTAKHRNHLALLERMIREGLPQRLADARSMQKAFELLRSYPTIGDFLAYQFVTDINYSEVTDFSEAEFVVPGPGAQSGLAKCFVDRGGLNEPELIRLMADVQQEEFDRLGVAFRSLWGRPLQLIDCQNLFCEVDKYSRVRHPDVAGRGDRTRIKQRYTPSTPPIEYWFPPKWNLNERIARETLRGNQ